MIIIGCYARGDHFFLVKISSPQISDHNPIDRMWYDDKHT